jgi:hypothetical protein
MPIPYDAMMDGRLAGNSRGGGWPITLSDFLFPIQPRRNARSGDSHEYARRRFGKSAYFR